MSDTEFLESERVLFESAARNVLGWDDSDLRRPTDWQGKPFGEYRWSAQEQAFKLWLAARKL